MNAIARLNESKSRSNRAKYKDDYTKAAGMIDVLIR